MVVAVPLTLLVCSSLLAGGVGRRARRHGRSCGRDSTHACQGEGAASKGAGEARLWAARVRCSAVTDDVLPLYPPQRVLQALQSGAEKETKAERAFVVEMNSHQRDCAELQGSVETLLRASDRLTMWQESVIDAAAAGDVAAVRRLIKSSARPAPASAASTLNLALRAASRASHSAMVEYLCSLPPQFGVDPRSARADDVARGRFARREVAAVVQELSGQGRDIDMCNGYVGAATMRRRVFRCLTR